VSHQTLSLDEVNAMPRAQLVEALLSVCHSRRWAQGVADARPFAGEAELAAVADEVWLGLTDSDWLEALSGHPRIGESGGSSQEFSRSEQAGMGDADAAVRAAIAEGNREYEDRFGHVFLIAAAGRSAAEILANLRQRLGNGAEHELRVAAEEHRRITRLRLQKLLT
jgi:OHCU decarboxylase